MKKIVVALAALVWAGGAYAGDFHRLSTLRCSQCHTMHGSRQHSLSNGAVDPDYTLADQTAAQAAGLYEKLLMKDGTNRVCLACHDAKAAYPDVLGVNAGSVAALTRSAGALNGSSSPVAPGGNYNDWMGHSLGDINDPPGFAVPGSWDPDPAGGGLNCGNCHAVHGSPAFRNLGLSQYMGNDPQIGFTTNPFYTAGPTYNEKDLTTGVRASIAFDATKDVTITAQSSSTTTLALNGAYDTRQVVFGIGSGNGAFTTPTGEAWQTNGFNAYCAACHGNFHGTANTRGPSSTHFIRHPTSGIARADGLLTTTADGMNNAQTDLVRPAWTGAVGGSFEAACLTCHKGHGNLRGYGLLYPDHTGATSANYEEGDADPIEGSGATATYPIRNLCITCHAQGRF